MTEKRRGQSKALHDAGEMECCELYGEYCYPCAESGVESQKRMQQQRKRRRK